MSIHSRLLAITAALDAGAKVLADKPLCTSLDQLDAIERSLAAAEGEQQLSLLLEKRFYRATLACIKLARHPGRVARAGERRR